MGKRKAFVLVPFVQHEVQRRWTESRKANNSGPRRPETVGKADIVPALVRWWR